MIDAVAPFADYIIVVNNSNKDGRFSKIAANKGIVLSEVKHGLHIAELLKEIFKESMEK